MSDRKARAKAGFEDGKGHSNRDLGDLLEDYNGVEVGHSCATVFLVEINAKIAQFGVAFA